jgi:hypothetical protein
MHFASELGSNYGAVYSRVRLSKGAHRKNCVHQNGYLRGHETFGNLTLRVLSCAGDEVSDVLEVHISGFLSNAGLGTFYSYGGLVDGKQTSK